MLSCHISSLYSLYPLSCVSLHLPLSPFPFSQEGEVRFLICTDVAARGIDIRGIPFVVNVTLPDEKQNYVHRIGRVGRADRMGLAISLVSKVKEKVNKLGGSKGHTVHILSLCVIAHGAFVPRSPSGENV